MNKVGKKTSKRLTAVLLSAALLGASFAGMNYISVQNAEAARTDYGLADTSQHGVILHCWNWSYNNIKKYMKDIAAAGYTSVQTSPVQQPKDFYWEGVNYSNVGIPNGTGGADGNWWKMYQPVTFSICDNGYSWLGTKSEFKAMCDEAEKYGVKVIVDIVANHMGNIQGYKIGDQETVMGDISPQVGEFWNPDMLTDPSYWHISTSWTHSSDGRFDVTQGNMGMPDLNTGDKKVQKMVLGLLNECIDCGADGFRFDAAKHIETPADNPSFASDFWDVVLDGARDHYKTVNGYDGIYFYGETLNRLDDSKAEAYYRSKMSLTDNSTSDNYRNSVINGQVGALSFGGYNGYIGGQGDKCVLWAESHDTYMGGGSSYDANDADILKTWAMIASRKDPTGLFFARPYYSKDILAGDVSKARQSTDVILSNIDQTQLGDVGSLTWADKTAVEANRFRNFFVGQSEKLGSSGNTAYNVRGNTGIVIVRGDGAGAVSLSVGMKDGTYTDQVSDEKFTVSGGTIKGNIKNKYGIAVIYNPTVDYGDVTPAQPSVIKLSAALADGSSTFTTDTADVKITLSGVKSAVYETSEGFTGSVVSGAGINVGKYTSTGGEVELKLTATADDGATKTKSFKFSKKGERTGVPEMSGGGVVFDNEEYKWAEVYCYAYSGDGAVKNADWPGVKMTEVEGNYWTYNFPESLSGDINVIFNNNSGVQYPGAGAPGLAMKADETKLFTDNALTELPPGTKPMKVNVTLSSDRVAPGEKVKIITEIQNSKGNTVFNCHFTDGTSSVSKDSAGTSYEISHTFSKKGKYIIAVNIKDDVSSVTTAKTIIVGDADEESLTVSDVSSEESDVSESSVKESSVDESSSTESSEYELPIIHESSGEIEIIKGDVNGDSIADIADALMIARKDAALISFNSDQEKAGDVNKDNTVDIADALMVARFDAGLISI